MKLESYVSIAEAASYAEVKVATIYSAIRNGRLQCGYDRSGKMVVLWSSLSQWRLTIRRPWDFEDPDFMTTAQAARLAGGTTGAIIAEASRGSIKSHKAPGGRVLVDRVAFQDWMKAKGLPGPTLDPGEKWLTATQVAKLVGYTASGEVCKAIKNGVISAVKVKQPGKVKGYRIAESEALAWQARRGAPFPERGDDDLTINEASRVGSIAVNTLHRAVKKGEWAASVGWKEGHPAMLISRKDLENYCKTRKDLRSRRQLSESLGLLPQALHSVV